MELGKMVRTSLRLISLLSSIRCFSLSLSPSPCLPPSLPPSVCPLPLSFVLFFSGLGMKSQFPHGTSNLSGGLQYFEQGCNNILDLYSLEIIVAHKKGRCILDNPFSHLESIISLWIVILSLSIKINECFLNHQILLVKEKFNDNLISNAFITIYY